MHLTLTPQILPDADSFNVIADWPGTDKADEIVLVSGHLDSWDLATGANDDASGVVSAMGVIDTLRKLDYHPHRTIRVVAWMNEENGGRGGQAYNDVRQGAMPTSNSPPTKTTTARAVRSACAPASAKPAAKLLAPLQAALYADGRRRLPPRRRDGFRRPERAGSDRRAELRAAGSIRLGLLQLPPHPGRYLRQGRTRTTCAATWPSWRRRPGSWPIWTSRSAGRTIAGRGVVSRPIE